MNSMNSFSNGDAAYHREQNEIKRLQEALAATVEQRDDLMVAAETIEINAEECLDFDGYTAILVPIDDYHKLMEAIASVKGETK